MSKARLPSAADQLHVQLLLLQGSDELIECAEQLALQYQLWSKQKAQAIANYEATRLAAAKASAEQQAWLGTLPWVFYQSHCSQLQDVASALEDAKLALRAERNEQFRQQEELDEALQWRQRLERCRVSRERERIRAEAERLEVAARERARQEAARLERERARRDERQAALAREHAQLLAQLELERERRLPHRALAAVQTEETSQTLPKPAAIPTGAASAKDLADQSDDDGGYSDEGFESPGESYEDDFDEDENEDEDEDDEDDENDEDEDRSEISEMSSEKGSSMSSSFQSSGSSPRKAMVPTRAATAVPASARMSARKADSESNGSISESIPEESDWSRSSSRKVKSKAALDNRKARDYESELSASAAESISAISSQQPARRPVMTRQEQSDFESEVLSASEASFSKSSGKRSRLSPSRVDSSVISESIASGSHSHVSESIPSISG
eukprot:TRINITY_DN15365_c0_g5_i1.p1 TRINITY_DN15365_c0_g5~~TRINITY_DN15365_c0_g5_i1.p1  ORF type:complete len:448 (+),score=117.47 TRINITY_DN15365_c0_g5_i1:68-1411(+)